MKVRILPIILVCITLLTLGCTSNKALKKVGPEPCEYKGEQSCTENYITTASSTEPEVKYSYSLSFVEFDEQGHIQDRKQINNVTKYIRDQGDDQDIVLFIHGWHHGAANDDSNVKDFRESLKKLAMRSPSRTVTGVYVGWRGESIDIPIIRKTTFWDRKNVSVQVGLGGVTELLSRLEDISAKKDRTRLIAIGHSFGGSVLFSATKNKFYSKLLELDNQRYKLHGQLDERQFRDTYVLLNPAIENIQYAPLNDLANEMVKNQPDIFSASAPPSLTVFMSKGDNATGIAFPVGRFFSTLFENHNAVERDDRFGKTVKYSQYAMDVKALGHYTPFITHELESLSDRKADSFCKKEPHPKSIPVHSTSIGPNYDSINENWTLEFQESQTKLTHLGNSPAFSPIWVVSVDESIIEDHNAIFGEQFNCYLEELMLLNTPSHN